MALDTNTLKCFLSVVETGNITRTANMIGRTQSAVSQQIVRLESLLGKTLFNRENGIKLTRDGEIFYEYAKRIYQLQREAISRLNELTFEAEIKIGLPEDFASKILTGVIQHFSELYPKVNLNVECDLTENILKRFQQNEFDVCVTKVLNREQIPNNARVLQDDLVWMGSKDFNKKLKKDAVIPLILSPKMSLYRELALETLDRSGFKWRIVFSSGSYLSKTAAVIAGLGITVVPKSLVVRNANLSIIHHLPSLGSVNLCILQTRHSPTIQYLVELLMKLISGAI